MSIFYHEEPPIPSKRFKFLTSTLKEAFANCRNCQRQLPSSKTEEENSSSDMDDEQEVVVSEIRSRAIEAKSRRKASFTLESFNWVLPPKNEESGHEETDDFFSVGSSLSRCSSARSIEAFVSAKSNFSRCSSLSSLDRRGLRIFIDKEFWNGLDCQEWRRRLIIQEFCHCEGWPFGLCRKTLLLPPLPKSPSESWTWRKKC